MRRKGESRLQRDCACQLAFRFRNEGEVLGQLGSKHVKGLFAAGNIFQLDLAQWSGTAPMPQGSFVQRQLADGVPLLQQDGAAAKIHFADQLKRCGACLCTQLTGGAMCRQTGQAFLHGGSFALVFLMCPHSGGSILVAQL